MVVSKFLAKKYLFLHIPLFVSVFFGCFKADIIKSWFNFNDGSNFETTDYISVSLKTSSYLTRFVCVDSLSKRKVKLETYPKIALLFKTVGDNWWRISHFSLFRAFGNAKGIFVLESNFN